MIMTAAIAADDKSSLERTPTMIVLENQLKKLEAELETKDDESEKMLRSVEQKYNTLKVRTNTTGIFLKLKILYIFIC
jgi:ATP-dependent Lon protease